MKSFRFPNIYDQYSIKKHHLLLLVIASFLVTLSIFSKYALHFPYGDGPEYIMMTESFYNHGSPDLRQEDPESYMKYLNSRNIPIHRNDEYINYFNKFEKDVPFMKGYYPSVINNSNWYSYHFWFYSLLNVPSRYFLELIDGDIQITFLLTNLLLIFIAIWVIINLEKLSCADKVFLSLFLVFSPLLWYVDWSHAEVYSGVLVFLGTLFFYYRKLYTSIILFVLASFQNQTIAILALLVSINILITQGLSKKTILKLFLCNFWALIPNLFYFYWFKVGSLLATDGTLSIDSISFKRFWHFFFDLNQGLVYGIPLILFLFITLFLSDIIRKKSLKIYFLLIGVPIMSLFFMQVTNWNAGNVVIKRYGVWIAPLFIIPVYYRIKKTKPKTFYTVIIICLASQAYALFSQHDFSKIYWHANQLKPIAKWTLDNHPSWYNPEAEVILERLDPDSYSSTDSVRTYIRDDSTITKFILREGAVQQFLHRGVSPKVVDSLEKNLCYFGGYAQINFEDFQKIGYKQADDQYIPIIEKVKEQARLEKQKQYYKDQIYNNPEWLEGIRNQSIEWGVPLEEAISINIDYLIVNK